MATQNTVEYKGELISEDEFLAQLEGELIAHQDEEDAAQAATLVAAARSDELHASASSADSTTPETNKISDDSDEDMESDTEYEDEEEVEKPEPPKILGPFRTPEQMAESIKRLYEFVDVNDPEDVARAAAMRAKAAEAARDAAMVVFKAGPPPVIIAPQGTAEETPAAPSYDSDDESDEDADEEAKEKEASDAWRTSGIVRPHWVPKRAFPPQPYNASSPEWSPTNPNWMSFAPGLVMSFRPGRW